MSNTQDRALVQSFRADKDVLVIRLPGGPLEVAVDIGTEGAEPACRCYRCGRLLIASTVRTDDAMDRPICSWCVR